MIIILDKVWLDINNELIEMTKLKKLPFQLLWIVGALNICNQAGILPRVKVMVSIFVWVDRDYWDNFFEQIFFSLPKLIHRIFLKQGL